MRIVTTPALTIGGRLRRNYAPTLDKGLIQNPYRPAGSLIWPTLNFVQRARFGLSRFPLPSPYLVIFGVQQRPHGPDLY